MALETYLGYRLGKEEHRTRLKATVHNRILELFGSVAEKMILRRHQSVKSITDCLIPYTILLMIAILRCRL